VQVTAEGFSLPRLKWRELLFVGALKADGDAFVRDPLRPLPPFRLPGLFPEGVRFHATESGDRILLRPASATSAGPPSRESSL
jgi:hypothetical protein